MIAIEGSAARRLLGGPVNGALNVEYFLDYSEFSG